MCFCLQGSRALLGQGEQSGPCTPRGQSQMAEESYRETIQLMTLERLGNRQRVQLWGGVGSPSIYVQQRMGDQLMRRRERVFVPAQIKVKVL